MSISREQTSERIVAVWDKDANARLPIHIANDKGRYHLSANYEGQSHVFDWFASRNRLAEYSILTTLLRRDEVQRELPDLLLSKQPWGSGSEFSIVLTDGFIMESPFLLDGRIAQALYAGGAYGQSELDAKSAKQLATAFCEELFEQRYSEIVLFSNLSAWTPWFRGIAWDWTAFLFDRRKRTFAILATTDSD